MTAQSGGSAASSAVVISGAFSRVAIPPSRADRRGPDGHPRLVIGRYEDVAKGPTPAGPPRARRTPGCLEFDVRGYF